MPTSVIHFPWSQFRFRKLFWLSNNFNLFAWMTNELSNSSKQWPRKLQKSRGADPFLGVQNTPKTRILEFYCIFMWQFLKSRGAKSPPAPPVARPLDFFPHCAYNIFGALLFIIQLVRRSKSKVCMHEWSSDLAAFDGKSAIKSFWARNLKNRKESWRFGWLLLPMP